MKDPLFDEDLHAALEELPSGFDVLAAATWLRRRLGPGLGREAAELNDLRTRARGRLEGASKLLLTRKGLEQASSTPVARARAQRLARDGGGGLVLDATAGLGADSAALAAAGLVVVSADRDARLCGLLRFNLRVLGHPTRVVQASAEAPALRPDLLVLDPDRRPHSPRAGREERHLRPDLWSPTLESCLERLGEARGGALKLPPGLDPPHLELPRCRTSWQWVSLAGELKELVLWTGCLAHPGGQREVLAVDSSGAHAQIAGGGDVHTAPLSGSAAEAVSWIAEPDPGVIRSGLIGELARTEGLAPLGPEIAYLGGDHPPTSPLLRGWRVLEQCPLDRKRVRRLLGRHGIGPLTVKKRGHPESASSLAQRLRGPGKRRGLLLITRLESGHRAYLLARRAERDTD